MINEEYHEQEYREIFGGEGAEQSLLTRRISITWEDIRFKSPRKRGMWGFTSPTEYQENLKGIWGGASPGEIVAILGQFQSGKSLLLNVLSGDVKMKRGDLLSGRVLVNGFKRGHKWRHICTHVTQSQQEQYGVLSCEEQLKFRAQLALPAIWTEARRERVVDWVIQSLDLENRRHFAVEDMTSGDRKLLSIGLGLVGLPRVLILDEPTQGLDPTQAKEVMKMLHRFTHELQMTTIIAERQLREVSIDLVDRILVLGQGATVYYGAISAALGYFESRLHITIPEHGDSSLTYILDAINGVGCRRNPGRLQLIINEWESYALENQLNRGNYPIAAFMEDDEIFRSSNWFKEFSEQLSRNLHLFFRTRIICIGQTLFALAMAFMISFSAFQLDEEHSFSARARFNALYFTVLLVQFCSFILFVAICYKDKLVLRQERRDAHARVSPAYLSGWLVIYGYRFIMVTIVTCIVYFIVGLRMPFNYTLVFWLALLADAWVAMGMGYLLVTLIENSALAELLASFIFFVCIWYSGDFAYNPECTWILRWIAYLSPIFYAFNALANNEFNEIGGKGEELVKEVGLDSLGVWPSIGILLGFGMCYMFLGYFTLSYSTRCNRNYI